MLLKKYKRLLDIFFNWKIKSEHEDFFKETKIVAILTAYKRKDYFISQIESLLHQTVKIDRIIIFNNGTINFKYLKRRFKEKLFIINSDLNTKYWGRFAISNLCNSEYVLILDDDIVPGSKWLENCLRLCTEKNCIVTGNGRCINNESFYGDDGFVDTDIKIGFGGHSWFFKKEWLKYFICEKPLNYFTGEDISFSALCKIKGGIETWLPKQEYETSAHKYNFSGDDKASFRTNNWDTIRKEMCKHFQKQGWSIQ